MSNTGQCGSREHYQKLVRTYASAPINEFYKPDLEISDGKAVIRFEVGRKMHHAAHAVHGSVYFKALDDAAFFAANGWLTHRSGRLFFAESELIDQDGRQIARGSGTFARSRIALTPEIGYQLRE